MSTNNKFPIGIITDQQLLLLFIDWFGLFLGKSFGIHSSGSSGSNIWTFTLKDESICKIERTDISGNLLLDAPKMIADEVKKLAREALNKTIAKDLGEPSWWKTSFVSKSGLTEVSLLHLMRSLSEHKRFEGTWRLGGEALLHFVQKAKEHPPFFPDQELKIVFRSLGPGHGPFGKASAQEFITKIRAAVVFATGADLQGIPHLWPATDQERSEAQASLAQGNVPELHSDGVLLWPSLAALITPNNREALNRAIGAMIAYEHGLAQKTDPAALVFFVTAIEALSVPNTAWQNKRSVKRFEEFLLLSCPEAVDNILNHANFIQAFGNLKKRKDFIDRLYLLRSRPVHTGQFGSYAGFEQIDPTIRIALVSELTRAAITAFIRRPFTLIFGHPELDPVIELKLTYEEYALLKTQSKRSKKTVPDWIRLVALAEATKHSRSTDKR